MQTLPAPLPCPLPLAAAPGRRLRAAEPDARRCPGRSRGGQAPRSAQADQAAQADQVRPRGLPPRGAAEGDPGHGEAEHRSGRQGQGRQGPGARLAGSGALQGRRGGGAAVRLLPCRGGQEALAGPGAVRLQLRAGSRLQPSVARVDGEPPPRHAQDRRRRWPGPVREQGTRLPVPGVAVAIPDLGMEVQTDGKGQFSFDGVRPGKYKALHHLGRAQARDGGGGCQKGRAGAGHLLPGAADGQPLRDRGPRQAAQDRGHPGDPAPEGADHRPRHLRRSRARGGEPARRGPAALRRRRAC